MRRRFQKQFELLAVFCFAATLSAQTAKHHSHSLPRFFNPEDEDKGFEDAQPPSDVVLNALLETREAKESDSELNGMGREKLRSLFRVAAIHLGPGDE